MEDNSFLIVILGAAWLFCKPPGIAHKTYCEIQVQQINQKSAN